MKTVVYMLISACVAFYYLFSPATRPDVPFWPTMSITAGFLAVMSLILQRKQFQSDYSFEFQHIINGLLAAVFLYILFWVGHLVSTKILPFAANQINSIYDIRAEQNPWLISSLLLFVIGPAEEIFWRGFIQKRLGERYGTWIGFMAAAAIYALVHIWSFNLMLIAAAALCGGFWGLLYMRTKNLWPCIISHAVWDVVIFMLLPIR